MLEIEDYYGIDDIRELDQWQREFNIPPTEMAPIIFDHKGSRHLVQALWKDKKFKKHFPDGLSNWTALAPPWMSFPLLIRYILSTSMCAPGLRQHFTSQLC
jgi:hypothetical protein